jgi:guanylate kinase
MGSEPLLFIVSAPSGAGKTSLCRTVINRVPRLHFSISYTTRPLRHYERDGVDYRFVPLDRFQKMIEEGQFVEWTKIYGNFYGTSKVSVDEWRARGMDVIFDIDHVGAQRIKETYKDSVTIFILPPSYEELEQRLTQRGTEEDAVKRERLNKAKAELVQANWYQYRIVNDKFEKALEQLKGIIDSERLKKGRG